MKSARISELLVCRARPLAVPAGAGADQPDDGRAGVAGLRGAVDDDRIGHARQRGERHDGEGRGARDVEVNGVRARRVIRIRDGLAQGAGAAVAAVGDEEGGRRRAEPAGGREDEQQYVTNQ